jgi:DNA topoisomerase-1
MKLIIAEKPIAAKRIADILGNPQLIIKNRVECYSVDGAMVVPLKGHISNLDFSAGYKDWEKTDLFKLTNAQINYTVNNKGVERTLESLAPQCDELQIATDYDREGESIGKEAVSIVTRKNPNVKITRAKFSALTAIEVKNAFSNLSDFSFNLADSADARREIDLIWGAVLTRYVSTASRRFGKEFLSVGRVQTPALTLVVEREKEIRAFKPEPFWTVYIQCDKKGKKFNAVYEEDKLFDQALADSVASKKATVSRVKDVEKKRVEIAPPSPFNTTEFMRAASMLGFQPRTAMSLAESLYMAGFVSYPRTDNTHYPTSIDLREILNKFKNSADFGEIAEALLKQKKLKPTHGKKKATDHPPIHPVELADKSKLNKYEWKIYELIVRRFFATLATSAELETVKVNMDYEGMRFIARGKTILSNGWREYYPYSKSEEVILPELEEEEIVKVDDIKKDRKETKPKPRYTPAALIKTLDELNLGTKSTRAEILQKLIDRRYIEGRQSFTPSNVAFSVIDALEQYAPEVTKPDMTAKLEKDMDRVEKGVKTKDTVVIASRKLLSKVLKDLVKHKENIGEKIKDSLKADDVLGECPACGGNLILIRMRKGTRFVGCSNYYKKGCRTSFPLPAKGKITNLNRLCKDCNLPVIEVTYFKRRPFQMCINHKCVSKADWGKKKAKKNESGDKHKKVDSG